MLKNCIIYISILNFHIFHIHIILKLFILQIEEARSHIRRSVDITHTMALALIKECRKRNVDCIVAPYEADAQLAYLNIKNYAQIVITEDSDLILFGCTKVCLLNVQNN